MIQGVFKRLFLEEKGTGLRVFSITNKNAKNFLTEKGGLRLFSEQIRRQRFFSTKKGA